ncbi:recombinase family protein [Streptomyces rubiginosohelvolus]|uniref:recombinase family protein n=1 Tax=Streptomyces rubiginosohelvolus TaxID=67362 RepID=UPI003663E888
MHISEMFRLVRGTGHILDVLDVLHRDQVAFRIHDGAFSAMDLTARHPRTGELLSTVKFMVQTLAAAGELQRDLQRELTYDGLRAAEAKGSKGGRRPAVPADKTDDVRTSCLEGRSIAALARDHDVSRGAIRTAVADLMPDHTPTEEDVPAASELRLEQDHRLSVDRCTGVPRGRTRTGSRRSSPDHDQSPRQPLYRCSPRPEDDSGQFADLDRSLRGHRAAAGDREDRPHIPPASRSPDFGPLRIQKLQDTVRRSPHLGIEKPHLPINGRLHSPLTLIRHAGTLRTPLVEAQRIDLPAR